MAYALALFTAWAALWAAWAVSRVPPPLPPARPAPVLVETLPWTVQAPPERPVLYRPRVTAEGRLNRALIIGAYNRADAPVAAYLRSIGWE